MPTIVILGAGAVGLSLAGRLASHSSVYVACRPSHAASINERGLKMSGIWGDQIVPGITCISGPSEIPADADYLIITAKGTDTQKICEEYQQSLRTCPVVTLQNGIGNEDTISRYASVTIGGTIITNFSIEGDGHVRVKSESGPVMAGLWNGGDPDQVARLVSHFSSCGIPAHISPDIRGAKWEKSLLNIAVNPLCGILQIPVGSTGDVILKEIISGLIHETFAVMQAHHIRVSWVNAEEYLNHLYTIQIPDFYPVFPSMYYDIRDGKKTEIDLLNGYIAAEGARLNIPTPMNQCITDLVKMKQTLH